MSSFVTTPNKHTVAHFHEDELVCVRIQVHAVAFLMLMFSTIDLLQSHDDTTCTVAVSCRTEGSTHKPSENEDDVVGPYALKAAPGVVPIL